MKRFLMSLMVLGFVLTSFTVSNSNNKPNKDENKGITFQTISFQDALKLAKKENKLIFIDAYTVWCGPCRYMSSTTFKDEAVGEYFNKRFINVKIEMEKDADGPEVARRYGVRAYPTMLFINGDGKLVGSIIGYHKAEEFLAKTKMVK